MIPTVSCPKGQPGVPEAPPNWPCAQDGWTRLKRGFGHRALPCERLRNKSGPIFRASTTSTSQYACVNNRPL